MSVNILDSNRQLKSIANGDISIATLADTAIVTTNAANVTFANKARPMSFCAFTTT